MKASEKSIIREWARAIQNEYDRADGHFKDLQEMSRKCGLPAYCSAQVNCEQITASAAASSADKSRAGTLYNQYVTANAKEDALRSLLSALASDSGEGFSY